MERQASFFLLVKRKHAPVPAAAEITPTIASRPPLKAEPVASAEVASGFSEFEAADSAALSVAAAVLSASAFDSAAGSAAALSAAKKMYSPPIVSL